MIKTENDKTILNAEMAESIRKIFYYSFGPIAICYDYDQLTAVERSCITRQAFDQLCTWVRAREDNEKLMRLQLQVHDEIQVAVPARVHAEDLPWREGCVICENEGRHGNDRPHVMAGQE